MLSNYSNHISRLIVIATAAYIYNRVKREEFLTNMGVIASMHAVTIAWPRFYPSFCPNTSSEMTWDTAILNNLKHPSSLAVNFIKCCVNSLNLSQKIAAFITRTALCAVGQYGISCILNQNNHPSSYIRLAEVLVSQTILNTALALVTNNCASYAATMFEK